MLISGKWWRGGDTERVLVGRGGRSNSLEGDWTTRVPGVRRESKLRKNDLVLEKRGESSHCPSSKKSKTPLKQNSASTQVGANTAYLPLPIHNSMAVEGVSQSPTS